jgi:hypothetical protein
MEQFRPFPPTELIDQAEEEEAIRLAHSVRDEIALDSNQFIRLVSASHRLCF